MDDDRFGFFGFNSCIWIIIIIIIICCCCSPGFFGFGGCGGYKE